MGQVPTHIKDSAVALKFLKVSNLSDLASLLGVPSRRLSYVIYKLNGGREFQYDTIQIPKRTGGTRTIKSPRPPLKTIQKRLADVLKDVYKIRDPAHGFLEKRSIISNAMVHKGKRSILNLDLKDFFDSITFPRIRGMFLSYPYRLPPEVATLLAQICCLNGCLPQGAPTSPIVSNMICSTLDGDLQIFAAKNGCYYTRYADDITFSSGANEIPTALGYAASNQAFLSKELLEIIDGNGFQVNPSKTRIQTRHNRQEVTGLVVNRFPNVNRQYVREIRSILHNWNKKGIQDCLNTYNSKHQIVLTKTEFMRAISGKISFIENVRKASKRKLPNPKGVDFFRIRMTENVLRDFRGNVIRTEGQTDWMHLQHILGLFKANGLFTNLDVHFFKTKHDHFFGDGTLRKFCTAMNSGAIREFESSLLCLYDYDANFVISEHPSGAPLKKHSDSVKSTTLAGPSVAISQNTFSIELLYPLSILQTQVSGRRLFLSNEFGSNGIHKAHPNIVCRKPIPSGEVKVIESEVFDSHSSRSLALSKTAFATAIVKGSIAVNLSDIQGFNPTFHRIEQCFQNW